MTENATPAPVAKEDQLSADLIDALRRAGLNHKQVNAAMIELVPYLVERDHKILMHGVATGRAEA